jgi:hypothetical protein
MLFRRMGWSLSFEKKTTQAYAYYYQQQKRKEKVHVKRGYSILLKKKCLRGDEGNILRLYELHSIQLCSRLSQRPWSYRRKKKADEDLR